MIQSPYQQNIEIVKGFFRKPIVLALSILSFVSIGLNMLMIIFNPFNAIVQKAVNDLSSYGGAQQASGNFQAGGSASVTTILFAITFLLFYLFSKKEEKNLSAPSMMFKVLSIIELVFMCIAAFFAIAAFIVFGILIFASANVSDIQITPAQLTAMSALYVILLIIVVPLIILAIFNSIAQLQFANSIRKSLGTIYLYRKGAAAYGVLNIVFAVFSLIFLGFAVFFVSVFAAAQNIYLSPIQVLSIILSTVLSVALYIVKGITAISYSSYIKNVSMKFQTEAPVQQTAHAQNPAQNPVVNYQPAPVSPIENNPYAPQPQPAPMAQPAPAAQPAPTAQQTIPQAPVREDLVQQPPVYEAVEENKSVEPQPVIEEPAAQAPVQQTQTPPEAPVKETPKPSEPREENYPAPRFCTECGKPVGPDDYFCNNCGKEIIRNI